ncbi:MAG: energy transducer TonB [Woeseiaceae bacterium]
MFSNFVTAIPAAGVMTALIILGMQALISMQPMVIDDRPRHKLDVFILEPRKEELHTLRFEPNRIDEPPTAPPLTPQQDFDITSATPPISVGAPVPRETVNRLAGPIIQDGPLAAIVRVQPTYPSSQSARGIEGYVVVEFDVLPDGTVGNVVVLESSSEAFERSAIQAASRFRYKARVVSGEPQLTSGVRYRFRFKMDK